MSGELRWILSGAGLLLSGVALAQVESGEQRVLSVDAPRLSRALIQLTEQTGLQLVYPAGQKGMDLPARPVVGRYAPLAALEHLLEGSGLEYELVDAHTVAIVDSEGSKGSDDAVADDSAQLNEVIVSSQRRKERLQDVPVSVQAVSGEQLTDQNQNSLFALTQTIPGVRVLPAGSSTAIAVRGITNGSQSIYPSVAVFSDDVLHGRSRMAVATFLDLERVELMKGPQTAYFGANAVAGALNLITRKPSKDFDVWTRALYGQHGQYAVEGAVGGPLSETLSARFAGTLNGMEGWLDSIATGRRLPKQDNRGGRVTLLYQPSDAFDATLKMEYGRHEEEGSVYGEPQQLFHCPLPAPFPLTFSGATCATALAQGWPIGFDNDQTPDTPGIGNWLESRESVLTANYQLGGYTLSSVSGYINYHFDIHTEGTGLAAVALGSPGSSPEQGEQFSQELRLASPLGERFEYLAGVYFQSDDTAFHSYTNYFSLNPAIVGSPALSALLPYLPLATAFDVDQGGRTFSLFGSLAWNATDRLKLTAGLRGSQIRKTTSQSLLYGTGTKDYGGFVPLPAELQVPAGYFGRGIPNAFADSRTDKAWMPSAKIQYTLRPQVMLYASFDRAFKGGGFNGNDTTADPANVPFGPEYARAYEVGLKSEWLDEALLMNLDVFRGDYSDLQVVSNRVDPVTNAAVSRIDNAASAVSQGVELETRWVMNRNVRLTLNALYNDAHYGKYTNASLSLEQSYCRPVLLTNPVCAALFPQGIGAVRDLSGQALIVAPKWSGSLSAHFTATLRGQYRLSAELSPYYTASYVISTLSPQLFSSGSSLRLDGRLGVTSPDGSWGVDLIGKNLTDRDIINSYGGIYLASRQEPRNLALQARYNW